MSLPPTRATGKLTSPEFWRSQWATAEPEAFPFLDEIASFLPARPGATFFEIGCAPGGLLAQFCSHGDYVAFGIDDSLAPAQIESFLQSRGVRVGRIFGGDFLGWTSDERYDIVASFGVVEHFTNPGPVVDRHFQLARPGGYVVVTFPNYARGQWLLRRLFDPRTLDGHNVSCMNLTFLRRAALRNQAAVVACRYVGGHFRFWDPGPAQRRSWLAERVMWRTVAGLRLLSRWLPGDSNPILSPYIVGIFRAQG